MAPQTLYSRLPDLTIVAFIYISLPALFHLNLFQSRHPCNICAARDLAMMPRHCYIRAAVAALMRPTQLANFKGPRGRRFVLQWEGKNIIQTVQLVSRPLDERPNLSQCRKMNRDEYALLFVIRNIIGRTSVTRERRRRRPSLLFRRRLLILKNAT